MKLSRTSVMAAVGIVVAVYVIGVIINLPPWATVLITIALLLLTAGIANQISSTPAQPAMPQPPAEPPRFDPEPMVLPTPSRAIADVRLPSGSPDYQFSFSAAVYWTPIGPGSRHADLSSVAVDALLQRAKRCLANLSPTEVSLSEHRLAALLGSAEADERQQVRTWAERIQLKLPDADVAHLRLLTGLKREQETSRLKRGLEQDLRAYLKDDVLETPGSALVWWLAKNPDEVERSVELYPILKRLSEAVNGVLEPIDEERPQAEEPMVSLNGHDPRIFSSSEQSAEPFVPGSARYEAAVETIVEGRDEAERSYIASQLAYLEESLERPEHAERIRHHFDVAPVETITSDGAPPAAEGQTSSADDSTTALNGDSRNPGEPQQPDDYREPFVSE